MIRNYVKANFVGLLVILTFLLVSHSSDCQILSERDSVIAINKKLTAIKISGNYISPQEGISIEEARKLIIQKLRKNGVKGKFESVLKVDEITTKEAWENIGVQLYKVEVDYAWIDAVVIIKNKEILTILSSTDTFGVFLADLDNDNTYEVYTNVYFGSGIISQEILGFNISSQEMYHLTMRNEKDFEVFVENGILMTRIYLHHNRNKVNKFDIGKLVLKKQDNKTKLEVDVN